MHIGSNYGDYTIPHIHINLPNSALLKYALERHEGELSTDGALVVNTGNRTGRSPQDRFIVKDTSTENSVDWGTVNQPISAEKFNALWRKASHYLEQKEYFVSHLSVGADPHYALTVTVKSELAWHNLFAQHLFIKPDKLSTDKPTTNDKKIWEVLSVPGFAAHGTEDGVNSNAAVILNFDAKKILICGTYYAGEMKKAMFSVLNYLLPPQNVLPMHCAANVGEKGDVALFFGLSGTGKTTLSADPERSLIGDDEHGWSDNGIFNFEGGCYAKCIDLSQEREPVIWNAIRDGAIMENVVINPTTKQPIYSDASRTQNTRAAYPRTHIPNRVQDNQAGQPSTVLFLTCDLHGVLPPVAKLSKEQAAYYFLSGYTALVGSTEVGQTQSIKSTFSTCFGAPFFPRPAKVYAELLMHRIEKTGCDVYLINTGWTGGAYGQGGQRFSLPVTRAIVQAVLNGEIKNTDFTTLPKFNFNIPKHLTNVDSQLLDPRNGWSNQQDFEKTTRELITKFKENFKRFDVSDAIIAAGPED